MGVRRRFLVSVHLDVQGQALHTFLAGEVCAETLHRYVDLQPIGSVRTRESFS